jgi:hypothetical protein
MLDRPTHPSTARLVVSGLAVVLGLASPAAAQKPGKSAPQSKAKVTVARPKAAGASSRLIAGVNARGELDPSDPVMAEDKTPYEAWTYHGQAGEVLTITMRSYKADAFVLVMRQTDKGLEPIAGDDDGLGGGTTDAGVRVTLPADGDYTIVANASATLGPRFFYGPYTLEVVSSLGATPDWAALYPGGGDASGRYAVVVGISDYPGDEHDLSAARR